MKRKSFETDEILSATDQRRLEMNIQKDYLRYNQLSNELHDLDIQDAKRVETVKKIVIVLESLRMMENAQLKYSALLKNEKLDPPDADAANDQEKEKEKEDTEDEVPKAKDSDNANDGKGTQTKQTAQAPQSTYERKYNHLLIEHNVAMNDLEVIRKENEKLLLEVQILQQQQSHQRFLSHFKKPSLSSTDMNSMKDLEEIRKGNQKLQLEVHNSSPLLSRTKGLSSSNTATTGSSGSNDQSRPTKKQKVFEKSNFSTTPYLQKIIRHKDSSGSSGSSKSPALDNILNTPSGLLDSTDKSKRKEKGRAERQRLRRGRSRQEEQELESEPQSSTPSTPSKSPVKVHKPNKEMSIKFDSNSDEENSDVNASDGKGKRQDSPNRVSSGVAHRASTNSSPGSASNADSGSGSEEEEDDDDDESEAPESDSTSDASSYRGQKAKPKSKKVILKRKKKVVAGGDDSFLDSDTVS
ncbi:unnamed protein product [Ambrosiozyma monospora]|uniref:Unnamed protein product n=1 Tax=Ambrosiozyma monospora TaxID=43982 RepID=A0ACB5T1L2_AMBMO|nr:unnamed protein product [Ambrosiozyma monospora]